MRPPLRCSTRCFSVARGNDTGAPARQRWTTPPKLAGRWRAQGALRKGIALFKGRRSAGVPHAQLFHQGYAPSQRGGS